MDEFTFKEIIIAFAAWFAGLWLFGKCWQSMKDDYSDDRDQE